MKSVYVDYNATTPIDSKVKKVLIDAFDLYANGSKKAEKNTSQLQKQNDKKAFGDLLQEAVKKYNL